jgi:hypothetical protein
MEGQEQIIVGFISTKTIFPVKTTCLLTENGLFYYFFTTGALPQLVISSYNYNRLVKV